MPEIPQILERYLKAVTRQVCVSVFFLFWSLYKTNRFHVAVCLFSNRSQRTSKCGKNISNTLVASHADVLRGSSRVPAPRGAGTRHMESYLLNYRIFISIHFGTLQEERKGEGRKGKVSPQPLPPPFPFLPIPYPLWFPGINFVWTEKGM